MTYKMVAGERGLRAASADVLTHVWTWQIDASDASSSDQLGVCVRAITATLLTPARLTSSVCVCVLSDWCVCYQTGVRVCYQTGVCVCYQTGVCVCAIRLVCVRYQAGVCVYYQTGACACYQTEWRQTRANHD